MEEKNSYTGSDLPFEKLELCALRVHPEHRQDEARLMRSCWFDYRDMHPAAKTYLYAELYRQQTLRFYESCVDVRTVEDARPFFPDDIFMSRDMSAMWGARHAADEWCLPYDFILRFAQERFLSRGQRMFPRPNQLYGEELEHDVKLAWQERLGRQITYATSERYRMRRWAGQLAQAQHLHFVIEQIKRRPAPRHAVLARMLNEDVLSVPMIAVHFGQEEAGAAERYCAEYLVSQN